MSKKFLLLFPLLSGVPLFLTGAFRHPPEPAFSFVAQPMTLAAELDGARLGATGLLDNAIERLAPARVAWLHVCVWQRMTDTAATFESTGVLQIGPNHCARLELAVRTGTSLAHRVVVSDGHSFAQVVQLGKEPATVTSQLLVPDGLNPSAPPKPPTDILNELGCGGPYPLLKGLRARLSQVTAQTGLGQGRPVLRIGGSLSPVQAPGGTGAPGATDFCYLYLDTQTLWPGRLEWWGRDRRQVPRLLLEMEFRAPQVNRPLPMPECIRAFSYRPEGRT